MSEQQSPSESGAWWSIHSTTIMDMLYAVKNGRSPESVYVEAYNASLVTNPVNEDN
jgi:hypothetical protein